MSSWPPALAADEPEELSNIDLAPDDLWDTVEAIKIITHYFAPEGSVPSRSKRAFTSFRAASSLERTVFMGISTTSAISAD